MYCFGETFAFKIYGICIETHTICAHAHTHAYSRTTALCILNENYGIASSIQHDTALIYKWNGMKGRQQQQ